MNDIYETFVDADMHYYEEVKTMEKDFFQYINHLEIPDESLLEILSELRSIPNENH